MTYFLTERSVYSWGPYGTAFWGGYWAPPPGTAFGVSDSLFQVPVVARPKGYDTLVVSWGEPQEDYDYVMLVRNAYGAPLTPTDGRVLVQAPIGTLPHNEYSDSGLQQGRFYYYSVFVRTSTATPQWTRVGHTYGLVPIDFDFGDTLFQRLPEFYRFDDAQLPGHPTVPELANAGPLQRYLELLGRQLDVIRTEIKTTVESWDPMRIREDAVQWAATHYGFPYEPYIGGRQMRLLMRNWFYILKTKGTVPGIEAFASAISGYPVDVEMGVNLLLDRNDSEGLETAGRWSDGDASGHAPDPHFFIFNIASNIASIERDLTQPNYLADVDTAIKVTVGVGNILSWVMCGDGTSNDTIQLTAIPVDPSTRYSMQAGVRGGTLNNNTFITFAVMWFSPIGDFLSTAYTAAAGDCDQGVWKTLDTLIGDSPDTAAYAIPVIFVTSETAGQTWWFTGVQLEASDEPTAFQHARQAQIYLRPARINWAPNPSFEGSENPVVSMVGVASSTPQSTELELDRIRSFKWTPNGGASTASISFDDSIFVPYEEGQSWAGACWVRRVDTTGNVTAKMNVDWYLEGNLVGSSIGTVEASLLAGSWIPVGQEFVVPDLPDALTRLPFAGGYLQYASDAVANYTTEMVVIARIKHPHDFYVGEAVDIMSKWGAVTDQSWYFQKLAGDQLRFGFSSDGSDDNARTSTVALTNQQLVNRVWVKAHFLGDNLGATPGHDVTFYYSTKQRNDIAIDDDSWVQLGDTQTTPGTATIFDSTSKLRVGIRDGLFPSPCAGWFYRAQTYSDPAAVAPDVDINFQAVWDVGPVPLPFEDGATNVVDTGSGLLDFELDPDPIFLSARWELEVTTDEAPIGALHTDALLIEESGIPGYNYFDGSSDLTSADFMWAGEVDNSESLYYPNRYIRDKRLRELLPGYLPAQTEYELIYEHAFTSD